LSTPIPFHSTPDSFDFWGEEVLGFVSGMFGVRDLQKMVSIISGEKKQGKKGCLVRGPEDKKIEGDAETGRPSEKRRREKQNKSLTTTNQFAE